jgi:hypothetical protein
VEVLAARCRIVYGALTKLPAWERLMERGLRSKQRRSREVEGERSERRLKALAVMEEWLRGEA